MVINNKPQIRFKGFSDEWEKRKLGRIGETFTGLSGKTKEDFGHGDAKFVTYVNVFENPISNPNKTERVEIDEKQNQIKYGDVFFTTSSETPEDVGMSSVWLDNTENIYLNSFCFGYRPTTELDSYYLAFMLRSPSIRKKFMFLAQGISRYNISKTKVMELEVPVPEIDEQKKVGSFFKTLDDTIALHQRKLELLKEQKKGFLQKMFPKKGEKIPEIRFKGFSEEWEESKLGDVGDIVTGSTPKTSDSSNYGGDFLFVSPSDIQNNRYIANTIKKVTEKGFNTGRKVPKGSILFVSIGTIGKIGQASETLITNQQINTVIVNKEFNDNFLYSILEKKAIQIRTMASTQVIPIINKKEFSKVEISTPTLEEQRKTGEFFKTLDETISLYQQKLDCTKQFKKSMLQKMFV